jgi:hypothetical protein
MKGRLIHELVDGLRELIMEKRFLRRRVGRHMNDVILPNVIKVLNLISSHLKVIKVAVSDDDFAEVTLLDDWNNTKRHTVDLVNHKCSCRAWQVTGKPCRHALLGSCLTEAWKSKIMCMNTTLLTGSEQHMQI